VHSGVAAAQSTSSAVSIADQDKDGTLDLAEVKTAASAKFDKMSKEADVDHDGTLSVQELKSKSAHTLKRLID
jgi:Ca2+-binding EF-hand superfamily protein